jgi:hypothetical protein
MLAETRLENIEKMLVEIYNHLGLSGVRPLSINQVRVDSEKKILKWKAKRLKGEHERATSTR